MIITRPIVLNSEEAGRPDGPRCRSSPSLSARAASLARSALFAAALSVVACTSTPSIGTDVAVTGMPNAEVALRDSMRVVDAQMGKLGLLQPASIQRISAVPTPVVPGELQKVVTFTWDGGLDDGVRKLAANVGYAVAVAPAPPNPVGLPPLRVAVSIGPVPIIEAFRALGDAAGDRAMVRVDPGRRQVDVLYRA